MVRVSLSNKHVLYPCCSFSTPASHKFFMYYKSRNFLFDGIQQYISMKFLNCASIRVSLVCGPQFMHSILDFRKPLFDIVSELIEIYRFICLEIVGFSWFYVNYLIFFSNDLIHVYNHTRAEIHQSSFCLLFFLVYWYEFFFCRTFWKEFYYMQPQGLPIQSSTGFRNCKMYIYTTRLSMLFFFQTQLCFFREINLLFFPIV